VNADELAVIREHHTKNPYSDHCLWDGEAWPCTATKLLDALNDGFGRTLDERERRRLLRIASEASNSWVGRNWPSMEDMRRDGMGYHLVENSQKDPAIRRFIATFSPEFVSELLKSTAR
jgi:hypothetical protein